MLPKFSVRTVNGLGRIPGVRWFSQAKVQSVLEAIKLSDGSSLVS
jgi:hypothetical protein